MLFSHTEVNSFSNTLKALFLLVCSTFVMSDALAHKRSEDVSVIDNHTHLSLLNLSQNIDARVATMKLIAKTIANDTHIHQWIKNGASSDNEALLVNKLGFLVEEFGLTSASFADKNSNKYWNHEGFLRVLKPEVDTWYFAYLTSTEQDLISVYHDKNKHRVDLYVNYQQTDGNGLSGVATSFDGVVKALKASSFAQQGNIFIVDGTGRIQVHDNPDIAGKSSLDQIYPKLDLSLFLNPNSVEFTQSNATDNRLLGASYIPSMGWYLIADLETL